MIHRVEKRVRKKRGSTVETPTYYLRYRYGDMPSAKYVSLRVTDKEVAWQKAQEFKRQWEAEQAGVLLPKSLQVAAQKDLHSHLEDYLMI